MVFIRCTDTSRWLRSNRGFRGRLPEPAAPLSKCWMLHVHTARSHGDSTVTAEPGLGIRRMQSYRRRSVCTVARAVSPAPSTSPRLGDEYGWAVVWGPAARAAGVPRVGTRPGGCASVGCTVGSEASLLVGRGIESLLESRRRAAWGHTQIWAPGGRDGVWTLWRGKAGAGAGRVCVGSLACSGIWHHCAASLSCVRPSGPFTLAENNRLSAPGRGRGGGAPPTLKLAKHSTRRCG
jgi:hypothetical protein